LKAAALAKLPNAAAFAMFDIFFCSVKRRENHACENWRGGAARQTALRAVWRKGGGFAAASRIRQSRMRRAAQV